jgi:hypothetical protein
MKTLSAQSILLLGLVLFVACSDKPAAQDSASRTSPSHTIVVRIVFDLPGDDIGGQESQVLLDAIRDAILSRKAGDIVSSGHGMGTMEIVVGLGSDDSIEEIQKAIDETSPAAKYRIERRS